ncbi:MAG: sugar phosphate isomerase/epimerase [Candidatus Omnitrophica bacterium]|nr:sugar phosphate isomerase/epimerase [Candidatus Omnitrophota bacterium]
MKRLNLSGNSIFYSLSIGIMLAAIFGNTGQAADSPGWNVMVCNPLLRQLEMESTWEAANAVGVDAIELGVNSDLLCSSLYVGKERPYRLDTPDNAMKLRRAAQKNGLQTPVICAPIGLDPSLEHSSAPAWTKTLIQNAHYVGAKLIYFPIVAGNFSTPEYEDDLFVQRSIALLKELSAFGKEHDVIVAIENLSVYWNRPEILRSVMGAFQADDLNLCLDPINFYWYGHPRAKVYEIVREFIPRARHFHVKNVAHPEEMREAVRTPGWEYGKNSVPAADGDLDFKEILTWLHESGYQGAVSIEDDSLGHYPVEKRADILRMDVSYLRRIISELQK